MIEGMVQGLADRLQDNPDDLEGWLMLMRSYSVLGKPEKASASAGQALAAFEGSPSRQDAIRSAMAELGIKVD